MKKVYAFFLLAALLLELSVFQFRFWQSASYETIAVDTGGDVQFTEEGGVLVIDLSRLEGSVHNLSVSIQNNMTQTFWAGQNEVSGTFEVECPIYISVYYKSGGEVRKLPSQLLFENGEFGRNIFYFPRGVEIDSVLISADGGILTGLELNAHSPFHFNGKRVIVVFFILSFLFAFRPRGAGWSRSFFTETGSIRRENIGIIAAAAAVLLALFGYLMSQNPVYDMAGEDLFPFYQELARGLAQGHTYLTDVSAEPLLALEDPYDLQERREKQVPWKLDHVYYQGRYYIYYGIVPCIVYYLPVYLLTGGNAPTAVFLWILAAVYLAAEALFLSALYRRYRPEGSTALFLMGYFLIALVTPFSALAAADTATYYVPILSGLDLFFLGGYFYLRAAAKMEREERAYGELATGSVCIALIAGCRPQLILYAAVLLPILLPYAIETGDRLRRWCAFLLPVLPIAAGLMAYNVARFGNPLEFGYAYHLTINGSQETQRWEDIVVSLRFFLTRHLSFQRGFPYVRFLPMQWDNPYEVSNMPISGGVLMLYPLLWLGLLCFAGRGQDRRGRECFWVSRLTVAIGVFLAMFAAVMGGLTPRYRMDFSTLLGLAAAMMIWCYRTGAAQRRAIWKRLRRGLVTVLLLLCLCSAYIQFWELDIISMAEKNSVVAAQSEAAIEFWR